MEVKNQSGQTLVEYILLLAVAVSLVLTFYNSNAFKRLFGAQGQIGKSIKSQNEFSYRHAISVNGKTQTRSADVPRDNKSISNHPSYADPYGGGTRFFGPQATYGE